MQATSAAKLRAVTPSIGRRSAPPRYVVQITSELHDQLIHPIFQTARLQPGQFHRQNTRFAIQRFSRMSARARMGAVIDLEEFIALLTAEMHRLKERLDVFSGSGVL
jgi:hypothetical protein